MLENFKIKLNVQIDAMILEADKEDEGDDLHTKNSPDGLQDTKSLKMSKFRMNL